MSRFRKKPVEVDAVRWDGNFTTAVQFVSCEFSVSGANGEMLLHLPTLEGEMTANVGDWIICGIAGEFYPCKPDIFDATYEPVSGPVGSSTEQEQK